MLHGTDHTCRKCVPDSIEGLAYGERQQQQPIQQVTDQVFSCCRADKRQEHETHRFEPIIAKRVSEAVQTPRQLERSPLGDIQNARAADRRVDRKTPERLDRLPDIELQQEFKMRVGWWRFATKFVKPFRMGPGVLRL